jgi:hypothetical protein
MSAALAKKLQAFEGNVKEMSKSIQVPESKKKKIERDAGLKKKAEADAVASKKVRYIIS